MWERLDRICGQVILVWVGVKDAGGGVGEEGAVVGGGRGDECVCSWWMGLWGSAVEIG